MTAVAGGDTASVIVVGAGVLGAALAHRLTASGWHVTLVDQHPFGHPRSASGSNTRILRVAHGALVSDTRSAWDARSLWREIEEATGAELMLKTGMAWFAQADDSWEADSQTVLAQEGIPFERIEPDAASDLFPDVITEDLKYVLFEPEACVLHAARLVRALCEHALASGARFLHGRARRVGGDVEVEGERLTADRIVWACGAWALKLFPELVRGSVIQQDLLYFAVPSSWQSPKVPAWGEHHTGIAGHGDLCASGLKLGADCPGPELDPDTERRQPDPRQQALVRAYLAARFPALAHTPLVRTESCQTVVLHAELPEGVPTQAGQCLLQVADHPRTWLLGHGSGSAFKHAPAIARRMEELLARGW